MKKFLKLSILSIFILCNIQAKRTISIKNFTPYTFKIDKVEQLQTKTSNFKQLANRIKPFSETKILELPQNIGVKKDQTYIFKTTLTTSANPLKNKTINLFQEIVGKAVGSSIKWAFSADSIKPRFTNKKILWNHPLYLKRNYSDSKNGPHDITLRARAVKTITGTNIEYLIGGKNKHKKYSVEPADSADKLNILAYNLYIMDIKAAGISVEKKPGVETRVKLIPNYISGYDVIIFSEIFVNKLRRQLLEALKKIGYNYSTSILGSGFVWDKNKNKGKLGETLRQPLIVDFNSPLFGKSKLYTQAGNGESLITKGVIKPMSGGIIIVSKYPIKEAKELIYKTAGLSEDRFAKKGAVYAKIDKMGKLYNIFGTHPEAVLENVKLDQLKELKKFIDEQNIPKSEPVIIGGDMNIDTNNLGKMLNILNANNPKLIGNEKSTSDPYKNQLKHYSKIEPQKRLDYLLLEKQHEQPNNNTSFTEIRPITNNRLVQYDYKGKKTFPMLDLSDHYGIYGYFDFSK